MTLRQKGCSSRFANVCVTILIAAISFPGLLHGADAKKLKFVSESWEGYTNKDQTGMYFDILNAVYGANSYGMTLIPWKRAQKEFAAGKFDALVGEDSTRDVSYPRWPIDVNAFGAIFDAKKMPQWNRAALKDLKVIWVRGYDVSKFAPDIKPFSEVQDMAQGVKMVLGGRADVLIDFQEDIEKYTQKNKIKLVNHKVEKTDVPGGFTFVCFRKGPEGAAHAKNFDMAMDKLMNEGKLKALYEKYQFGSYFEEISKFVASHK